jgi:hypothetical protein
MLLTVFLPIAIRAIKPVYIKMVITWLYYFFNKISQKVIDEDEIAGSPRIYQGDYGAARDVLPS